MESALSAAARLTPIQTPKKAHRAGPRRAKLSRQVGVVLWLAVLGLTSSAGSTFGQAYRTWVGTVVEQKKYSIQIATLEGLVEIAIPASTPVEQLLERHQFNPVRQTVLYPLPSSQDPADPSEPITVVEPLPEDLVIEGWFLHANEKARLWTGTKKTLQRYRLWDNAQNLPESWQPGAAEAGTESIERIRGRVRRIVGPHEIEVEIEGQVLEVTLGERDARLAQRSVLQLTPFTTNVEVDAQQQEGQWVAQEVRYQRRGAAATGTAPRMLVLGDEHSMGLVRRLQTELGSAYSVIHPLQISRGRASWDRLAWWLGPTQTPGYQWDVIVANFGPIDMDTGLMSSQYQWKEWLQALKGTGARVIIVPLQAGRRNTEEETEALDEWNQKLQSIATAAAAEWVAPGNDPDLNSESNPDPVRQSLLKILQSPPPQ